MKTLAKFVSILILLALTNTLSIGMGYPMDMFAENGFEGNAYAKPKVRLLVRKENVTKERPVCNQKAETRTIVQKEKTPTKPASNRTPVSSSNTKGSLTFQLADLIWQKIVATTNYLANKKSNFAPFRALLRLGWNMAKHISVLSK